MVVVQQTDLQLRQRQRSRQNNNTRLGSWIIAVSVTLFLFIVLWITALASFLLTTEQEQQRSTQVVRSSLGNVGRDEGKDVHNNYENEFASCPVTSISSLSEAELHPVAGPRHMVTPPSDEGGTLTLLCCSTTKGYFSVLLHDKWAPLGVGHLLEMVESGYFHSKIPLFRCAKNDACQFGLSANPNVTKLYDSRHYSANNKLPDDPMWMPPGKEHRENAQGVRRYPAGMWTYAGAGPNSRTNQFVITLQPNLYMGGGSPWEVPLGELVGSKSFATIRRFYTGYGHKNAPGQPVLRREGYSERVQKEWPLMDLILGCDVVEQQEQ